MGMSDYCSIRIGKRRRELQPMKPSLQNIENVEVVEESRICADRYHRESTISKSKVTTRRQSTAWAFMVLLALSIRGCESFTSTGTAPARCSSAPQSTVVRVIEAEAPAVSTEERTFGFQPSIPEHSIFCENEPTDEREPADNHDEEDSSETRAESGNYSDADDEEAEKQARLDSVSKAAALLGNRKSRVKQNTAAKGTSVGTRRMGAASKARKGAGAMTRLTDAVRRGVGSSKVQNNEEDDDITFSSKLTQSAIQNAVGEILHASQPSNFGVLAEASAPFLDLAKIQNTPPPGTILFDCPKNSRGWKASDRVSVRVATQSDDLDIANLRLSVFSNFSADMRQSFCSRSCHVLNMRRNQGATCIVATVPRYGSILSDKKEIILGTAECSIHEFFGTRLGSKRQQNSILYITEVAVSPTARRKGIGAKIMQVRKKMSHATI